VPTDSPSAAEPNAPAHRSRPRGPRVSLDKAIKTMRETGADMKDKYKETARGGLALNIKER
jgi:L-serine deaminase